MLRAHRGSNFSLSTFTSALGSHGITIFEMIPLKFSFDLHLCRDKIFTIAIKFYSLRTVLAPPIIHICDKEFSISVTSDDSIFFVRALTRCLKNLKKDSEETDLFAKERETLYITAKKYFSIYVRGGGGGGCFSKVLKYISGKIMLKRNKRFSSSTSFCLRFSTKLFLRYVTS